MSSPMCRAGSRPGSAAAGRPRRARGRRRRRNPVVIVGEPADEIAEAWQDFSSLAIVWLALDALILAVLYVVLGRVLDPLRSLSRGMLQPGGRPLRDAPAEPEGEGACRHHQPLQHARRARSTSRARRIAGLYRQLISVQEEERREIANELHDEAGPCLFGITANASSIQNLADQLPDKRTVGDRAAASARFSPSSSG